MKLSRIERRAFDALLVLAADGSKVPADIEQSRRIFEELLDYALVETRAYYRFALISVELASPLLGAWKRFWVPFSKRTKAEQEAAIDGIQHSKISARRLIFKGLSAAIQLSHYARPEAQIGVGYDARKLNMHYQNISKGGSA
jgi:hypothetical protein